MKTPEALLFKYQNLCEYRDDYIFFSSIDEKYLTSEVIKENIQNKKDLIGRNDVFKKINIDKNYPDYLLNNINKYKDWIV